MPPSKKRKLISDSEATLEDHKEAETSETPSMSDGGNAIPATEQPVSEDTAGPDTSTVDKNLERQARFKALQARAVSL